jgi:hypothetical protein
MASSHARADAAQQLARVSPSLLSSQATAKASQCRVAAPGRLKLRLTCCLTTRAAALPPVAAAVDQHSAAGGSQLSMTKYGREQHAACAAVRLAAKLCQVHGATSALLTLYTV